MQRLRNYSRDLEPAIKHSLKPSTRNTFRYQPRVRLPDRAPGNNPFTDILNYGHSEFGEPVDGLVRSMSKVPGFDSAENEITEILWTNLPLGQGKGKRMLIKTAIAELTYVRKRLSTY